MIFLLIFIQNVISIHNINYLILSKMLVI